MLVDGFLVVVDLVAMVGLAEGDFVDWAGFFMVVDVDFVAAVGDILFVA